MTTPAPAVLALAESWASIDGRLGRFRACAADPKLDETEGRYSGYLADAEAMIERLDRRGFVIEPKRIRAAPSIIERALLRLQAILGVAFILYVLWGLLS